VTSVGFFCSEVSTLTLSLVFHADELAENDLVRGTPVHFPRGVDPPALEDRAK
jgi:hypothetical protein